MGRRRAAILLIHSQDAKGLVAAVTGFLYRHGANILGADEHRDDDAGQFLMRIEWDVEDFALGREEFARAFEQDVARRLGLNWRVEYTAEPPRVAIFVSRQLHCLADLLHRRAQGELDCDLRMVVSNHPDAAPLAAFHQVPFHHLPVSPDAKPSVESEQRSLLESAGVDLVVLARYMQVLSAEFTRPWAGRIINVHHSFLPAFSGARPYHAAFARGVKLIGATAHYVTEILDDGPIIEQEVIRVSHRDQLTDFIEKGRDAERLVLARAVRWHLERRVLLYGNKTVVFV
jgi:formyltetrahydrofolate deformylase